MRCTRRSVAVLAGMAFVAVSCGEPTPDVVVERRVGTPDGLPTAAEVVTTSTAPTADRHLSIDDALLDDGDVDPPWEFQHRSTEGPGYGAGPNQTDCGPFWQYERRYEFSNASALWWRDGGNLNHEIFRAPSAAAAAAYLDAARDLPETCGVTSWGEGDSFRIESVDLGNEQIVGLEFVQPYDEQHHVAISTRDDLISVVWVVQWPSFGGDPYPPASVDDLATVAELALARLYEAREVEVPDPAATPTTTEPGRPPPVAPTTFPETTLPPALTVPLPTLPPFEPVGAALFMLTDEDLVNLPGWEAGRPDQYEPTTSIPLENCAADWAAAEIEQTFTWEQRLWYLDRAAAMQYTGEVADGVSASDIVEAFAGLADCDVPGVPVHTEIVSRSIEIPGADAASEVDFVLTDPTTDQTATARIVLLSVDRRLTGFTLEWDHADPIEQQTIDRLLELAAAKLAL